MIELQADSEPAYLNQLMSLQLAFYFVASQVSADQTDLFHSDRFLKDDLFCFQADRYPFDRVLRVVMVFPGFEYSKSELQSDHKDHSFLSDLSKSISGPAHSVPVDKMCQNHP